MNSHKVRSMQYMAIVYTSIHQTCKKHKVSKQAYTRRWQCT